ncbi:MAG: carboxypeptidase-like regulatory domain-containing protein [Gemmatimonadota bacterium]|jgi:hypothetical protein
MERRLIPGACFWITLLLSVAGCRADDLLGPNAEQGIEGVVLLGPQCPVATVDDPCPDSPYQAWIRVRRPDGRTVTRIRSGEDGRFRVGLRPGSYRLDPESGNPLPSATEQEVEVEAGKYTEVVISFDTGIR